MYYYYLVYFDPELQRYEVESLEESHVNISAVNEHTYPFLIDNFVKAVALARRLQEMYDLKMQLELGSSAEEINSENSDQEKV